MTSGGKNKEWKHSIKTFLIELLLGIIVGGGGGRISLTAKTALAMLPIITILIIMLVVR